MTLQWNFYTGSNKNETLNLLSTMIIFTCKGEKVPLHQYLIFMVYLYQMYLFVCYKKLRSENNGLVES